MKELSLGVSVGKMPRSCDHHDLLFQTSSHATIAGYEQRDLVERIAATSMQVTRRDFDGNVAKDPVSTYPAPLVLPEDDLAWDPKCPPQSVRAWTRLRERNKVTPERRTIYFAGPPTIESGVDHIREWTVPHPKTKVKEKMVPFPPTEEVLEYLKAFYHGLPVKLLPSPGLSFTWEEASKRKGSKKVKEPTEHSLWLNTNTSKGAVGITTRATPNGAYSHQLNLNDLLDTAIEILPSDAYALLIMVEHDIYDEDEDDFACGMAYGGSRIAVVSGARYNPILDVDQDIEREHAWPASHCKDFVEWCCEGQDNIDYGHKGKKSKTIPNVPVNLAKVDSKKSPMHAAPAAHKKLPLLENKPSANVLSGLWLGRVTRTAGHELGHCFGIGHCTYMACLMQGSASIIEDSRQPPYLCPVDLVKVLTATGSTEDERDKAMLKFCDQYRGVHLFAAYAAWIKKKIEIGGI